MRAAGPADAPALLPLLRAFYVEDGIPWQPATEDALRALLADPSFGFVLVEEAADGIIGYVVITLGFSLELGGRDAFVDELYVAPENRGQGHGRRLLRSALDEAARRGVRTVHLEMAAEDEVKRSLYGSLGFRRRPHPLMTVAL